MKKFPLIICLLLSLALLSSCSNKGVANPSEQNTITKDSKSTPQPTKAVLTIKDFFSYKANTKYVYEGKGNEYASYHVFIDYIEGNGVQLRSNNGGTEMVKVLENKNGELAVALSKGECYYRENLTQNTTGNKEVLLKEPLITGTTWTLADNRKRSITNTDVEVITPMGSYRALEVTTEGKDDKTLDYYAPNIGLVKSVFTSKGSEISSLLIKMENNTPLIQTVKFYYPNVNDNKMYYVNKQLSFNTNDITKMIFENTFRDLPKGNFGKLLGPNAKIKSLYLNKDNMVYVDFTKEFTSEMNAGTGYESMILQSITNTIGIYYGVEKVYITVEGNPYSSGHIIMKKGEAFTVNLKDCLELK